MSNSLLLFHFLSPSFSQPPTGSTSSSTRASPANTVKGSNGTGARPAAANNISLADITSQLEKASLSMDEAARQTSSSSSSTSSSSSSFSSATLRRPSSGSSGGGGSQHRRAGSVGGASEQDAPSQRSSVNSACASASSMDSLDVDKVTAEGRSSPSTQGPTQTSTEVRPPVRSCKECWRKTLGTVAAC